MIKAIIIDDEEHAIINLRLLLQKYEDVVIVYEATTAEAGIESIIKHTVDLIFLDVKMPQKSGFEVIDAVIKKGITDFNVVFTTAYDEYAIKAIKYSAFDYLLKPIDENELKDVLDRYRAVGKVKIVENNTVLQNAISPREKIRIKTKETYEYLKSEEIVFIEGNGNYSSILLTDNRRILSCKTLKDFENDPDLFDFVRVHKTYLINKLYLSTFNPKTKVCILYYQNDKINVPVSTRMMKNLAF